MSAVLDTLSFAKRLKEGGFTEQQAETLASAEIGVLQGNLATKADLKDAITELRAELKADMADLKAEFKADIAGLRTELKIDIAKLQADTWWVRWIITGGVGLYVLRSLIEWLR
jgi:hypothetical protein